jgi:putative transposase
MDTKKVTTEYRVSQWAQIIKAQRESGQNIKDYCQTTGISRHAYFYWQRKLRALACTELARTEEPRNIVPSGWMQLTPKQAKDVLSIEINGYHITVNIETDPELLKKVCCILRSLV